MPIWFTKSGQLIRHWSNGFSGTEVSLNLLGASAFSFKWPGMWVMREKIWNLLMNTKYCVKICAMPTVMVIPFAAVASAALLSVPWWHVIGPRVCGKAQRMQHVNANWAKSSQTAMCFCISDPTQFQCSRASVNEILNWNQTVRPSATVARPPRPAISEEAIASAVAVTGNTGGIS